MRVERRAREQEREHKGLQQSPASVLKPDILPKSRKAEKSDSMSNILVTTRSHHITVINIGPKIYYIA